MAYRITTERQQRLAREAYNALYLLQQEEAFQDAPWLEREILTLHALLWNTAGVTKAGKPAKSKAGQDREQPLGSIPEAHGQEPAP
jgi:hypothetical protein